jgi:hypothetical protein
MARRFAREMLRRADELRDAVERSRPADHVVITLGLGSDYHAVTYSGDKPDGAPRLGNVIPFRPIRPSTPAKSSANATRPLSRASRPGSWAKRSPA